MSQPESHNPRLLILSASAGNGHVSAAESLVAAAQSLGVEAVHYDTLDHTGRAFKQWYGGGYATLVKRAPRTWGWLYWRSDRPGFAFYAQTGLDRAFCLRIEKLIRAHRPDWVVCTHSLPQPILVRLRRKYGFKVAVCVTDLYPHRMWLRGRPDRYFVPTESTKEKLAQRAPWARDIIEVTGMPIHPAFRKGPEPTERRVLLTAGGIAGGPFMDVAQTLAGTLAPLESPLTIVTGRNETLRKNLIAAKLGEHVTVTGKLSLEEMAEVMRSASVMIGKPGGLTSFESLASALPMVLYRPMLIPGQEEDNAKFLENAGSAITVDDLDSLGQVVSELLANPVRLAAMRKSAAAAAQPDAALRLIRSLIGSEK